MSEVGSMCETYIARANDQHVTRLELNTLLFSDGLNVFYRDLVTLEGTILDSLFVGPELVVDKDATSDKTSALMPVVERWYLLCKIVFSKVLC
jgi:hypothetical protein